MAPNKTSEHLAQNHQLSERKIFQKRAINKINLKKLSQDHHMQVPNLGQEKQQK